MSYILTHGLTHETRQAGATHGSNLDRDSHCLVLIFYIVHLMTRGSLPIRVAEATVGNLTNTVSTNGKVEPQVNFEAHAPFAGLIETLNIHEGEKVPKANCCWPWTTPKPKPVWPRRRRRSKEPRSTNRRRRAGAPRRSAIR